MKNLALVFVLLVFATPAFAWNCSDPLASRVPVPTGTSGSYGNGDGQLFMGTGTEGVKGQLYQCQVPTPNPTPSQSTQTQSQNQQQNNSQSQNSTTNSNSTSGSKSSSSAQGGSVSGSGNSSLSNSGNSTSNSSVSNNNTNNVSSASGSKIQNSGNSSSALSQSGNATNNGNNSNNYSSSETYNEVRQTPMAYSPDAAFTTSPCVKGFSGGASFPGGAGSLGISKTDKGCDSRQTAVVFHAIGNDLAAAKILCSTDAAKRAHLALTECQAIVIPPVPTVVRAPEPVVPPPTVIVVPAVPVAEPHPVAASRPRYTYHTVGSCYLVGGKPTNVCYRILDDAALALEQNTSAKIVLTGPVESGKLVPYLQKKVSPSRIEIRLADEQNWTVNVQTEIEEPNE